MDGKRRKETGLIEEKLLNICNKAFPPVFIMWITLAILKPLIEFKIISFLP